MIEYQIDTFVKGDVVLWPKHPYNTDVSVPHANDLATKSISAQFTASRSMVVTGESFSVKLPINFPHRSEEQRSKTDLRGDVDLAIGTANYIKERDAAFGTDPNLVILHDVLVLKDLRTQNGIVVRDLREMKNDEMTYVPALSIPFMGGEVARVAGKSVGKYWGEAYAAALGRAKAKFLLRYGLQLNTPSPQSIHDSFLL